MGSETKALLLLEAARQMAARGIEAVSVRDVTGEVGANVASVSYHFGGQQGLIDSVLEVYLLPVLLERERFFEGVSKRVGLRELLRGWIRPLVEEGRRSALGEKAFFALNLAALDYGRSQATAYGQGRGRLCKQLDLLAAAHLPGVAESTRRWRLQWALETMERALVRGRDLEFFLSRVSTRIPVDDLLERLLDYANAAICAPVSAVDSEVAKPTDVRKLPVSRTGQDEFSF